MSQDYRHACERAELLGLPIPSEEEWKESQRSEAENHATEGDDDAVIENLDSSHEAAQRVAGGLDELNTILNATQKKINSLKRVCGSVSSLLKIKVGSRHNTPDHKPTEPKTEDSTNVRENETAEDENLTVEVSEGTGSAKNSTTTQKKIDINEKMGSHLDKLDSLINKAENAQYSMQHQTKQMRKILK